MNSGPLLFLGLFATMACSWTGFILAPQLQLGGLSQTNTVVLGDALSKTYPLPLPGDAHAGEEVYRANGCAACHTQVVRPRELGPDIPRNLGARRSLAEDYLFDRPVMLGSQRIGPDLANFARLADTNGIYLRLYDPRLITRGSVMPPFRFLFEVHKVGFFPSPEALVLPDQDTPPAGYEIIPRPQARALAAYLLNRRQEGYLFEAPPPPLPKTNAVPTKVASPAAKPVKK